MTNQSEKQRAKYTALQSPSWPTKYQTDTTYLTESNWKCPRKNIPPIPPRTSRRQIYPTHEPPPTNYHSSMNTYNQKHHAPSIPTHLAMRYTNSQSAEPHRCFQNQLSPTRKKLYADNAVVVRRNRYKDDLENEENSKFEDEDSENLTEDNVEEEVGEEAEDDREETCGSLDKNYDEQETDDEIDEESEPPNQCRLQRLQLQGKEAMLRARQGLPAVEQRQEPRSHLRPKEPHKRYEDCLLRERYCDDNDVTEPPSEEEILPPSAPSKDITKKSASYYRRLWRPIRSAPNRHAIITSPTQAPRYGAKTETGSLMELETDNAKKCIRCGVSSNEEAWNSKKNCRFQERPNFSIRGSFGDNMDDRSQQILCSRCNFRHNLEHVKDKYDVAKSACYMAKPRRLKNNKPSIYDTSQEQAPIDDISSDYLPTRSRYLKDPPEIDHERAKHLVQCARSPTRICSRYKA